MASKKLFNIPYLGIDQWEDLHLLVGPRGEHSVIFRIVNPLIRFEGYAQGYDEFHQVLLNAVKLLGEGYLLQKLDVFSRGPYRPGPAEGFLQQKYNQHFEGREATHVETYLTITRQVRKRGLYTYNAKSIYEFQQVIGKLMGVLPSATLLDGKQINLLVLRLLTMSASSQKMQADNILPTDQELYFGQRAVRSVNLVDTEIIDLPAEVGAFVELNAKENLRGFPVDFLSFLFAVPGFDLMVFNQVIEIPNQAAILRELERKKKRQSSIPDAANQVGVEDIDRLFSDVARNNQLVVNCHFNILLAGEKEQVQRAANFTESSLFELGILPSRQGYNQLELFRGALPGNGAEIGAYDWFLTTCEAALCFFCKESLPVDEPSDFLIHFTDRRGIPVGIDPADLPMRTGRINNRNKFVLGPSGSGKSFFMNALIEQYMSYNMDVVIVDTGHSYSGLCAYFQGKYITYTDQKPITMNPFQIRAEEYNIEKKDFLVTLIGLLWKGAEGQFSQVERDVMAQVLSAYYGQYFSQMNTEQTADVQAIADLSFNSFYEFALETIPAIKIQERIPFEIDEFRYVLKKFYRGGEFEQILNEPADQSLFTERFIVFEIDAIKEHRVLFPIVTLIIMDVFLQKMRFRSDRRKALVVEEAWKAIASPLMAGYLLYLYKTVRKFWGEAIVVTQELGDIIGNAVVKDSILNNSDTVCLLDQTKFKDNYNEIASLLAITETERKKIFTINQLDNTENRSRFKEVYIRRGATGEVYGVEVSLHQYLCYTTEKPEKSAVEIYLHHFGNYDLAIDRFVKDQIQSGLSLAAFVRLINELKKPLNL